MTKALISKQPARRIIAEVVSDPVEVAKTKSQFEQFDRNLSWMEANADEVFKHRGKVVCIAGQELFVGDTALDAVAQAKAAHSDDNGWFTRLIPMEKRQNIVRLIGPGHGYCSAIG